MRKWTAWIGHAGIIALLAACGGESTDGTDPLSAGEGGAGNDAGGTGTAGSSAGGSSAASGGATSQGGTSSVGGTSQGGTAQGGTSQGGSNEGEAGDAGDGGSSGECDGVAAPPEGTKLCGTPAQAQLVSGLIGLEASWHFSLSSGNCGVHSGFDASAETEDVFIFRREDDYGNNVSILYPWSYTLDGHEDSNHLPSNELITAHVEHDCGLGFAIDFAFEDDDTVTVSDVRSEH